MKVKKPNTPPPRYGIPHTKFYPIFQIRFSTPPNTGHSPLPHTFPTTLTTKFLGSQTNDFKNAIFPYNRTPSAGQARMGIFAARRTKNKNFWHIKTPYITFPKIFRGPNFQIRISVNTSYHIPKSLQPQTKSYPIHHRQGSQLKLKPKTYLWDYDYILK